MTKISISFHIDEQMAFLAIESLLSQGKKVSKTAIISLCKRHLKAEGELFECAPLFTYGDNNFTPEEVTKLYEKIWIA